MRTTLLLLASLAMSLAPPVDEDPPPGPGDPTPPPADKKVRIGTWNLEWLGTPGMRAEPGKGVAQEPGDIAAYLESSRVDILALQEITVNRTDEGGKAYNTTLDKAFELMGPDWRYTLFPRNEAGAKTLWTGVAWNAKKARLVGKPLRLPIPEAYGVTGAKILDRSPHVARFELVSYENRRYSDFHLVVVHLKSNQGIEDPRKAVAHRQAEARLLFRTIRGLPFDEDPKARAYWPAERDWVVAGDWNLSEDDEDSENMLYKGGFAYREVIPTTVYGNESPDQIFYSEYQREFYECKSGVHGWSRNLDKRKEHKAKLSDHYLVYLDMNVTDDDDEGFPPDDDEMEAPANP